MGKNSDKFIELFADALSESDIVASRELSKIAIMLAKARTDRGMTQKEFAKFMDVSQGMVSKWESEYYNFSIETLAKICEKLNMNLEIKITPQWGSTAEGYGALAVRETD